MNTYTKHQKRIAISTLKMSDVGASVMGGMTKTEARQFLSDIGWSDNKIAQLEAIDTGVKNYPANIKPIGT